MLRISRTEVLVNYLKNKNMKIKRNLLATMALIVISSGIIVAPVFAEDSIGTTGEASVNLRGGMMNRGQVIGGMMRVKNSIFGTVTSISGNTIMVSGLQKLPEREQSSGSTPTLPTTVTYTVDASNAKITKAGVAGTIASVLVGDKVSVAGTVNGTNIVATNIYDGLMMKRGKGDDSNGPKNMPTTFPITGNGQPIVAGSISSIAGNTITITNKSGVSYTVDVSNAKIVQGQTLSTVSILKVGDNVVIQGSVTGTSVVASSVLDGGSSTTTGTTTVKHKGFFGTIGSFFSSIFGF